MGISVLLVDDERDFLDALCMRLTSRGFQVRLAFSGGEALEVLKNNDIDVVILDVQLPGRNGMTILHEIKRSWPAVEVIMLTGQISVPKAVHGMKAGAFEFLTKPANFDELLDRIHCAYQRKSGAI